jgi:hypothetical protein
MSSELIVKKYQYVSAPRSSQNAPLVGQVVAFAVTTAPAFLNLASLLQPTFNQASAQTAIVSGILGQDGNYVTIWSDTGADLGIIFGVTQASVTGGNAPVLATVGTVAAGVYTPAAGTCWRIPAGTSARFHLQPPQGPFGVQSFTGGAGEGVQAAGDLFMGYVGSAAGVCRLYQSNPPNP